MWQDKDLFKDYYVSTYRDGEHGSYYVRWYLRIFRRNSSDYDIHTPVTSFRVESKFPPNAQNPLNFPPYILIKYHKQWDTWASLIVEYCINDLKAQTIELVDVYDGN